MRSLLRPAALVLFPLTSALLMPLPADAGLMEDCTQTDNLNLAVESCTKLIDAGGKSDEALAEIYRARGLAEAMLGRASEAMVDFSAALKLHPDWVQALIDRGNAQDDRGDQESAITDYDRAIALDPTAVAAYYNRGIAHLKQGAAEKAIADYDRVIELDPNHKMAFNNRGVAYEYLGHERRAVADWLKAIEIGGAEDAAWWQKYLASRGHYSGRVDGRVSVELKAGLLACAQDPNC